MFSVSVGTPCLVLCPHFTFIPACTPSWACIGASHEGRLGRGHTHTHGCEGFDQVVGGGGRGGVLCVGLHAAALLCVQHTTT